MDQITLVSLLLDESGSMNTILDDTIGGFNTYLASLQDPTAGAVLFTFIKFDSNKIDKVCVGVPAADVPPLSRATYHPGASTPLIDAAYKTIIATADLVAQRSDSPHVLVVIQTDGMENASTEHTNDELHQLVKEKTAAGWGFVFLGAGIDAFAQASQWGISAGGTMSYARDKSAQTFQAVAMNTTTYRSTGATVSLDFADDQRTAAGETQGPPSISAVPTGTVGTPKIPTPPKRIRPAIVEDFSLVPAAEASEES